MLKCYSVIVVVCLFFFPGVYSSLAQDKYFVLFTDKNASPYSINNPENFLSYRSIERREKQKIPVQYYDLPVNPWYVDSLRSKGAEVWYTSRWFNGAVINADSVQLATIQNFPFVKSYDKVTRKRERNVFIPADTAVAVSRLLRTSSEDATYGFSFNQVSMLCGEVMHQDGFKGEGMLIAVLDAGFMNASSLSFFSHLYEEGRIKATYDFVENDTQIYEDHQHGTNVLSVMAGYEEGSLVGMAYKADYILLRTEAAEYELEIEEVNWLIAAEYADSAGADLINSSLGYTDFDDSSMDHTYADMDGNTTIVTRAADMAARTGILVVNSMGNKGNNPWKYLVAPADGDSVLAIGAVDGSGQHVAFSSRGPSADGRVKPDLVAKGQLTTVGNSSGLILSSNGTSFSAPLVTGLAAGFWQAYPELNNMQVADLLRRTASRYHSPDELYGYGIPNYCRARDLYEKEKKKTADFILMPVPFYDQQLEIIINEEDIGETLTIQVFDVSGKLIWKELIENAQKVNQLRMETASLARGVYIFSISGRNHRYAVKGLKH